MNYLIDGYNLLFRYHPKGSLEEQRRFIITWIQTVFAKKNLDGTIVFDGAHTSLEESGLAYAPPIEIVYTPKKQSADEWIIEKITLSKKRKNIIVVTDDQHLKKNVQALGAATQSRETFLQFLFKAKQINSSSAKTEIQESPKNFERLLKIFTEKYEKED